MLEIFLGWFGNMRVFFIVLGVVPFGVLLGSAASHLDGLNKDFSGEWVKGFPRFLTKVVLISTLFFSIASIPSVDDLWKVRIGLVKLELASPANVGKGVEEIGRIAAKLECKYLGCAKVEKK